MLPLWRARDEVVTRLRSLLGEAQAGRLGGRKMVRLEVQVAGFGVEQAMLWLRAQGSFPKVFFLNRDSRSDLHA